MSLQTWFNSFFSSEKTNSQSNKLTTHVLTTYGTDTTITTKSDEDCLEVLKLKDDLRQRRGRQIEELRNGLVNWSANRCSPVMPASWADRQGQKCLFDASVFGTCEQVDALKVEMDSHRRDCGKHYQFDAIEKWSRRMMFEHMPKLTIPEK